MSGVVNGLVVMFFVFFFKQKTAYEMRISDWSSDVCSSDLLPGASYADQGILFGDGFYTSAQNYLGAVGIPSAPNYLAIAGVATQAEIGRASCRERVCQYV